MPPDVAAPPTRYGIVKLDLVKEFIKGLPAKQYIEVTEAIDQLTNDPRPTGYQTMFTAPMTVLACAIATTQPNYYLVYTIDDQKTNITIMSIQEKRFS